VFFLFSDLPVLADRRPLFRVINFWFFFPPPPRLLVVALYGLDDVVL